ncbi:hypothetical protein TNCT_121461 [Trichonephila clavata]|uniref:Uncharacterized protein n=1 Tax=Trichonephila clavata TaxID=2740835 RepID=A0A8X6HDQ7_TRICU|nr:hypothetical protein TNCT_121461 [Trichonephila clavata]
MTGTKLAALFEMEILIFFLLLFTPRFSNDFHDFYSPDGCPPSRMQTQEATQIVSKVQRVPKILDGAGNFAKYSILSRSSPFPAKGDQTIHEHPGTYGGNFMEQCLDLCSDWHGGELR